MAFSVFVLTLGRRGKISFRFLLGWITMGVLIIVAGCLVFVVTPISRALGVTPATIGLIVAVGLPITISVELSSTVSKQQQHIRTLAEKLALLEEDVRRSKNES